MKHTDEKCPYQLGPHDSMGCAACEDSMRSKLEIAVKALEDIRGYVYDKCSCDAYGSCGCGYRCADLADDVLEDLNDSVS